MSVLAANTQARPGPGAAYALAVMVVAATLAFLDRQAINLVIDAIRGDMQITDIQFSLLQGAAFSLVYTVAMLPIAWGADRFSRKWIMVGSIIAWSCATIAFGLAQGFLALLAARACVAIGEAGLSPATISMVRDLYPSRRQGIAIACLTLSVYIGGGLSLIGGGPALSGLQGAQAAHGLPGHLSPWRFLFIGAGSLGVVAVGMLMVMREPERRRKAEEVISWAEYFRLIGGMWGRVATYLFAFAGLFLLFSAVGAWLPALFMRTHGWSPKQVGLVYGTTQLISGATGALSAGWFVDRLTARGDPAAQPKVVRIGALMLAAGGALAATLANPWLALAASGLALFGAGVCVALGAMGFQAMFPARFSGRGVATYLLVTGVLGASVGPTIVPVLAGWLGDGRSVGRAMSIWAVAAGVWSVTGLTVLLRLARKAAKVAGAAGAAV